mgnify:CR=1 FL=1
MGYMSMLLVVGFTAVIFISNVSRSNITQQAYENAMIAYDKVTRHNMAITALNIASTELYKNKDFRGFSNIIVDEGLSTTQIDTFSYGGQPYINIVTTAKYGKDWRGNSNAIDTVKSIGFFERFAKYVFFADKMFREMNFFSGDTIFSVDNGGYFHSNDTIPIANNYDYYDYDIINLPFPKIYVKNLQDIRSSVAVSWYGLGCRNSWAFINLGIPTDNEGRSVMGLASDIRSPFSWSDGTDPSIPQGSLNYYTPLPGDLSYTENAAKNGGLYIGPENYPSYYGTEVLKVEVSLKGNTLIVQKINGSTETIIFGDVGSIASNGVICIKDAEVGLDIKNVIGKYSIVSNVSSPYTVSKEIAAGRGSIYLLDNIKYVDTTSLFGIISYWDVLIKKNAINCFDSTVGPQYSLLSQKLDDNTYISENIDYDTSYQNYHINKNYRVDASIFCFKGGFGAEGIDNEFTGYRPTNNRVIVYGGLIFGKARVLRRYGDYTYNGDRNLGYRYKTILFNPLLLTEEPPYFPIGPLRMRSRLE